MNHLSDSVSIVDVGATPAARRRARCWSATSRATSCSPARAATRAFITTAHRGQNRAAAIRSLTTRGHRPRRRLGVRRDQPRATRSAARRSRSSTLFADTPRALAVSPDGSTVYAGGLPLRQPDDDGLARALVCNGGAGAGAVHRRRRRRCRAACRLPNTNFQGVPQPEVGLIVKFDPARTSGRTSSAATGTTPCASPCPTTTCSRSTPTPARRRQTACFAASAPSSSTWSINPVSGEGLRHQHRGAQRGALRGSRRSSAAPPCADTCTRRASPCSTARACCRAT